MSMYQKRLKGRVRNLTCKINQIHKELKEKDLQVAVASTYRFIYWGKLRWGRRWEHVKFALYTLYKSVLGYYLTVENNPCPEKTRPNHALSQVQKNLATIEDTNSFHWLRS